MLSVRRRWPRMGRWLPIVPFLLGGFGCANAPECARSSDCGRSEICIDGMCRLEVGPAEDAGETMPDAGPTSSDAGVDAASPPTDAGVLDAGTDAGTPAGACGAEPCGLWRLGPAATSWEAWPRGSGTFAPTAPVQAAFDLESLGVAYVLTGETYHVLRLSDREWIADGARDTLFSGRASGVALRSGYSVPADHAGGDGTVETVTVESATEVYSFGVTLATQRFDHLSTIAFADQWDGQPLAPSRSAIRFSWLDVTNARGFARGSLDAVCGSGGDTLGPYGAYVTASSVHYLEAGVCFDFSGRDAYGAEPPFSFTGAPEVGAVGAAFWNQGSLWLVAE